MQKYNFSVGYYQNNQWGDTLMNLIEDYDDDIDEVYFPLPNQPSGRDSLSRNQDVVAAETLLKEEITQCRNRGKKLTLLLNAACYSDKFLNKKYLEELKTVVADYVENYGVTAVTTTIPSFALMLKKIYGDQIETRASVNMRVASIDAMEYLSEEFDAFYVKRELYRSMKYLEHCRKWADEKGKKLYALANSGCLADCPWQSQHDNNIAHEVVAEIMADGTPIPDCGHWFKHKKDFASILKSTFIRPEDIHRYAHIFDGFKLATRDYFLPRLVVQAYTAERYEGLLTDLLEPGHTHQFNPSNGLSNRQFPVSWIDKVSNCNRHCEACDYCKKMAQTLFLPYTSDMDFSNYLIKKQH